MCVRCKTTPTVRTFCHECGPAFRSISHWGYFRMPNAFGFIPRLEAQTYGDSGPYHRTWYPGDREPIARAWENPFMLGAER